MQTKQLVQFSAVAHAGNISEAAKRLNIAQPALSQAILGLEQDLGVQLFERHRRGVDLTDAGTILLERAQSILSQIEATREIVRDVDVSPSGRVAVAFPASVAHAIAEPLCTTIINDYPRINLEIEEGLTGNLVRWLRSGRIDLMINFDVEESGEISYEPLIEEELFLFGRDLKSSKDIFFKELPDYPLILPSPEHAMGKAIEKFENQTGIRLNRLPVRIAVHPMLSLVRSGTGYSISPWSLIHDIADGSSIKARRIVKPSISRTAHLVHHRNKPETAAVRVVRDAIVNSIVQTHQSGVWRGKLLLKDKP